MKKAIVSFICVIALLSMLPFTGFANEADNEWYYADFGLPDHYERQAYEDRIKNWNDIETIMRYPNWVEDNCLCESVDRGIINPICDKETVIKKLDSVSTALVVEPTGHRIQFTNTNYDALNETTPVITLTEVVIQQVCRLQNNLKIQVGDIIWLTESYGVIERYGIEMFFAEHSSRQRPLYGSSLVFVDDATISENESVYRFDENFYWALTDTVDKEPFDRMHMMETYVYNNYIQYEYYDTALSYFGLLENAKSTDAKKAPDLINLTTIIISISVLVTLGSLSYSIIKTKKHTEK